MAGGIDWFRWHHGSVTNQKFPLVAKRAGASVAEVIAVWACLLEAASMNERERGMLDAEPDFEAMDCALGMDDGRAAAIFGALCGRGLLDEHLQVTAWPRRQPKRERDDDSSTGRVRAFRERQRHETPSNATGSTETPRGEESREEVNTSLLSQAPARPADEAPALALVETKPKGPPDCPHAEVLALWAEVLPALPQHLPSQWRNGRAEHLRARWRETAVEKGWQDKGAGLAYFRKLFAYVGQSEFLSGKARPSNGKRPFVIELEWLVNATNWAKVIEGKYHPEEATA